MITPAAVWGGVIELTGAICPLTPLEKWLRDQAGIASYEGGFIAHYVVPILYPAGLDHTLQVLLGVAVIVINAAGYWWVLSRRRPAAPPTTAPNR